MGNLRGRGKEFVSPNFFLVGRLNTYKTFNVDSFKGSFRSLWRLTSTIDVQERSDHFLFTFTNERDVNRVKKGGLLSFQHAMVVVNDFDGLSPISDVPLDFVWTWVQNFGIPSAFLTVATIILIGETLGQVLMVDHCGVRESHARVQIVLSLHQPVRLEEKVCFSPKEEYGLTFKYERLLGCCSQCACIDHVGASYPEAASSTKSSATGPSSAVVNGPSVPPIVFSANIPQTLSSSLLANLKLRFFSKRGGGW